MTRIEVAYETNRHSAAICIATGKKLSRILELYRKYVNFEIVQTCNTTHNE